MDVVSFQRKWIGASNLKERTASQSHFNDLCDLLDVPKPTDIDHTGETYTFERGDQWRLGTSDYRRKIFDLEDIYT